MRYMEDPRQNELFDSFEQILSPTAYRRIKNGWQYLFRSSILKLMPAKKLAEHFHPEMGRPTKELYSIAALLFVMEFRDWTHAEAADAYMFIVNPSDPDATFCGHKGPGYQVQLAETCSSANDVQRITVAEVETAVDSDSAAIAKVVDHYEQHGHQPDTLYADTAYGSDDNFEMCHRGRSWESFEDYRNCWEG